MAASPLDMPTRRPAAQATRLAYSVTTAQAAQREAARKIRMAREAEKALRAGDISCAGCDGEISKSAAVRLWGCTWCAL